MRAGAGGLQGGHFYSPHPVMKSRQKVFVSSDTTKYLNAVIKVKLCWHFCIEGALRRPMTYEDHPTILSIHFLLTNAQKGTKLI